MKIEEVKSGKRGKAKVLTVTTVEAPKRQAPAKPRKPNLRGLTYNPANLWVQSLNDPFTHQGVRFGYGTMLPTGMITLYARFTRQVTSTGYMAIALQPNARMGVAPTTPSPANSWFAYTDSPSDSAAPNNPTWSAGQFVNQALLGQIAGMSRTVSAGIRAIPSFPSTSNPGMVYSGAFPYAWASSANWDGLLTKPTLFSNATTLNGPQGFVLTGQPALRMSSAKYGACALARPVDQRAEEFDSVLTIPGAATLSSNQTLAWSCPVIVFTGIPSGGTITFEIVVNIETTQTPQVGALNDDLGNQASQDEPSLLDVSSSLGELWRRVSNLVLDPSVPTASLAALKVAKKAGWTEAVLAGAAAYSSDAADRAHRSARGRRHLVDHDFVEL